MDMQTRTLLFDPMVSGDLNAIIPDCRIELKGECITAPAVLTICEGREFQIAVHLMDSDTPTFLTRTKRVMRPDDQLTVSGQIEGEVSLEFKVFPRSNLRRSGRNTSKVVLQASGADLVPEGMDTMTVTEIGQLLGCESDQEKSSEKSSFTAHMIFHGPRIHVRNAGSEEERVNDFMGKSASSSLDTFLFNGKGWEAALIQVKKELHLHVRSSADGSINEEREIISLIDCIKRSVAFTHGFHPWPAYMEIRRDHRIIKRFLTPRLKLRQTYLAPLSHSLGHMPSNDKTHSMISTIADGFSAMDPGQRKKLDELLWNVKSSALGDLPPLTKMLILCSASDGLTKLLGKDMGPGNTLDEWKLIAKNLGISWGWMEEVMSVRKKYRDDLSHGRLWQSDDFSYDEYYLDYPRLGCAFMTVIAAYCGYDGLIVASPFGNIVEEIAAIKDSADKKSSRSD